MMVKLQLHSLISIAIAGIVLVAPTVGYGSVGEIGKIRGSGVLERNGDVVDGNTGVGVQSMDTAVTAKGQMQIDFIDETRVDITEHSRLLIDEFVYDPAAGKGALSLKASMGTVRYASGQIAKKYQQNVKIRTPSATIGVRGTDFIMVVDEVGSTMVTLLPSCDEDGYCYTGAIEVETDVGFVLMTQAFQTTITSISSQPPSKPLILDIDERMISQLLIVRKKNPYDEEEDMIRDKARKMFDFLGIDFLEFEGLDDDALQSSIEGIWKTQLDETDYMLADMLYDMLDQLNAMLMALFKDELTLSTEQLFREQQVYGFDPETGINFQKDGEFWVVEREDNQGNNYFRLRLRDAYGYVLDLGQNDWEYYDYRVGNSMGNSITIKQSDF
tara:strand:- start:1623 stop:2780 length:1158 start_codon:yes stop_codon:yes gene_type:complete